MLLNFKVQAQTYERTIGNTLLDYGVGLNLFNALNSTAALLFSIAVALTLTFIAVSGVRFITAEGDKAKKETAKNSLLYSLFALAIIFLFNLIITYMIQLFGGGPTEVKEYPTLTSTFLPPTP